MCHHSGRAEQHQTQREQAGQHDGRQPVRRPTQRRARRPAQGDHQRGERDERGRHPPVEGDDAEVLLQRVEPGERGDREHRGPDARARRSLHHAGAQRRRVPGAITVARRPGRLGKPRGQGCRGEAQRDAHPARERVAAHREQQRRARGGRHLRDQSRGAGLAAELRVLVLGVHVGEPVVEQRLERAAGERAAQPPEHEARGEPGEPRKRHPDAEPDGLQHPGHHERAAPREPVGERPGGNLGEEADAGPDGEQQRHLCDRQPGVEEQQRIEGIDRQGVGEERPGDGEPCERAGGGRQPARTGRGQPNGMRRR